MKALVDQVDQVLRGDAELAALFPELAADLVGKYPDGVALYYKMALPDAPMPYIVHLEELNTPPGEHPMIRTGPYRLDVWDFNPDAARALAIVGRIKALLSGAHLPIGQSYGTLHFVRAGDVKTDAEDVHRIAMEFAAWAYDEETAQAVLDRA